MCMMTMNDKYLVAILNTSYAHFNILLNFTLLRSTIKCHFIHYNYTPGIWCTCHIEDSTYIHNAIVQ